MSGTTWSTELCGEVNALRMQFNATSAAALRPFGWPGLAFQEFTNLNGWASSSAPCNDWSYAVAD